MSSVDIRVALSSPDVEVRRDAVLAAGRAHDPSLADPLLIALGDSDWRVREESVRVITQVAVEFELLPRLIAAICQGSNVGLRTAAREVLQALGTAAAPAVIAAMPNVEPNARKFLLDTLVCDGADEVLSTLVQAVRGDDPMEAVSAMDALASIGGARAEAALRERLSTVDPLLCASALDALEKLGARVPWSELQPLLGHRLLGRVAIDALGRSADARAIAPLMAALADRSSRVRARALLALQRLLASDAQLRDPISAQLRAQTSELLSGLAEFAEHEQLEVARAAFSVLACARDTHAVRAALRLASRSIALSDLTPELLGWEAAAASIALEIAAGDATLRAAALSLAATIIEPQWLSGERGELASVAAALLARLRAALHDHDAGVQVAALRALGTVAQAVDAVALVEKAQHEREDFARAAAAALAELAMREPSAVAGALANASIIGAASTQLAELIATHAALDALPRLRAALLSDVASLRVSAISGLSLLEDAAAADLVALALNDENVEVQVAAIDALPRIGSARAVEALLLFESSDNDVQVALARALAALEDPRATQRLRKLARIGPPGVRVFAIQGLQGQSDAALDELLVESLGDVDPEVVKQALTSLGAAGGDRACGRIAIALDHPAWDVRRLAATLLSETADASALPPLRARAQIEADGLVRAAIEEAIDTLEAG